MARFPIRIDRPWRLVLLPFGATTQRSYVEVTENEVRFRFGALFDHTFPRDHIDGAYRRTWPLWMGIGWRTNFRGLIGLTGSFEGVVEVHLTEAAQALGFLNYDRIAVSLEDPDVFVAALGFPTPAEQAVMQRATAKTAAKPVAEAQAPAATSSRPVRKAAPRKTARPKKAAAAKKPAAKRGTTRKRAADN